MSETQSPPPDSLQAPPAESLSSSSSASSSCTTPAPLPQNQQSQNHQNHQSPSTPQPAEIEKRERLSPISPHPVHHVPEPRVLRNQMEFALSFADAHSSHTPIAHDSHAEAIVSPNSAATSLEALMLHHHHSLQQQQHQQQQQEKHEHQQQQSLSHDNTDNSNDKDQNNNFSNNFTTHNNSAPLSNNIFDPSNAAEMVASAPANGYLPDQMECTYTATTPALAPPYPSMDNASSTSSSPTSSYTLSGNGDVSAAGNGSVALSSPSTGVASSKHANIATTGAAPTTTATTTTSTPPKPTATLANNLPSNVDLQALLTKLSPATPTLPQQLHSAPQSPHHPQLNGTPTPSSAHPSVQPQSPAQKTRTPQSNPPPQPTNHPLPPVPVVSSSVPGHPAAGYPASLPPPPNFNQHKAPQPASVTEDEDDEDVRPFTVDEEEEFTRFLADERDYVTQGQWDRFPPGSRLFIGALPPTHPPSSPALPLLACHYRTARPSACLPTQSENVKNLQVATASFLQETSPPKKLPNVICSACFTSMAAWHRSPSSRRTGLSSSWISRRVHRPFATSKDHR